MPPSNLSRRSVVRRAAGGHIVSDGTGRKGLLLSPHARYLPPAKPPAFIDVFLGMIFKDLNVTSVLKYT